MPRWLGGEARRLSLPAGVQPWTSGWEGAWRLVQEDEQGRIVAHTGLQMPGVMDAVLAPHVDDAPLGFSWRKRPGLKLGLGHASQPEMPYTAELLPPSVEVAGAGAGAGRPARGAAAWVGQWRLWAPTASQVHVCLSAGPQSPVTDVLALQLDRASGVWQAQQAWPQAPRQHYYRYLLRQVLPDGSERRQRVTDPYAASLSADGARTWLGTGEEPWTEPAGWRGHRRPAAPKALPDLTVYELHVRDFSVRDTRLPAPLRGTYEALAHPLSQGRQHLAALARAGLGDVHLLPVFDFGSVPEQGCQPDDSQPAAPAERAASQAQARQVAGRSRDCFNWGYDPVHYGAPEGSYSRHPDDGEARLREFRAAVMGLHQIGLRVGMDVVYNHVYAAGQQPHSVLDRVVPGYYLRRSATGAIERSTCCDNTATEHRMMARLMADTLERWVLLHGIDSFRFDLMGHQPKAEMLAIEQRLRARAGRWIPLLGEGWNFGEVADGRRFDQAAQTVLAGSGIASFNDRLRDALRGGGAGDRGQDMVVRPGWLTQFSPQDAKPWSALSQAQQDEAARRVDALRVGLQGSLRGLAVPSMARGAQARADELPYGGQVLAYADRPGEAVNYAENHDNLTLWDQLQLKLPADMPLAQKLRVQVLAHAMVLLSQGTPYLHAGGELLRSKSLDRNSYDSGDRFNGLDWDGARHGFGQGLPPAPDNEDSWPVMAPLLADARLQVPPALVRQATARVQDWLAVRREMPLLRLASREAVARQLQVLPLQGELGAQVLAAVLRDDSGQPAALLVLNASSQAPQLPWPQEVGQLSWRLHPRLARGADHAVHRQAKWLRNADGAVLAVPGLTAQVWVRAGR